MVNIPYGRQDITEADIDAVVAVLKSDFLTQGPLVPKFEQAVSNYCGAHYAVALNSATSALHVACLALGLGPGDWLWTSTITFVASANCGLYCGAKVDFVDIDPLSYNLCPVALERKLEKAASEGRIPKIVVAVHLCGQPCDMLAINVLAHRYGFKVIEDASHAIGGRFLGEPIGNCRYSDVTIFSFHPVKIITTAEGGMAVTNDPELAKKIALLRTHGITRDPAHMTCDSEGPWFYQQIELGFNYRLSDLQAALGLSQMDRLQSYVLKRKQLANRYDELLSALPVTTPWQSSESYSSWHLYVIRIQTGKVKKSKREIFDTLRESGIEVNLHYIPVYKHPYYQRMGFNASDFPQSQQYYSETISLPMYATLSESQQDRVVAEIKSAIQT